jgi:hypothetical protein
MKTLDGQVDYHINIDHSVAVDLPVLTYPESHLKANIVLESKVKTTVKRKRRKYGNKVNE